MEVAEEYHLSSVPKLCLSLISSAFQRCRVTEDLCRLSVVLASSSPSAFHPPLVRISISDTGIGSSVDEFRLLQSGGLSIGCDKWDGLLSVRTTSISDKDVKHYRVNFRDSNSRTTLTQLPSNPKNGVKFSGTEVCLSTSERIDVLVAEINRFIQKMLILKIPNVAIEVVVKCENIPGSRNEHFFLANENNPLPFSASSIERLESGLQDYVLKHGNRLESNCDSCCPNRNAIQPLSCFKQYYTLPPSLPRELLKVGSGTACSRVSHRTSGLVVDVVILISQLDSSFLCSRACCSRSEVLYFQEFRPCSISQSLVDALTSVDWKSYGLALRDVVGESGRLIEWEGLPPCTYMAMVIHCYHKKDMIPSARWKIQPDRNLIKRAVKHALNNLKEKHAGSLLSAHTLKICGYAPDLARSIAGLILSSNDPNFQEECFSLLGLRHSEVGEETVKDCINEKIVSVLELNDRKSQSSKEVAPFLFEDDYGGDSNFQDEEYGEQEGEDEFNSFD